MGSLPGWRFVLGASALTGVVLIGWLCRSWIRTLTFDDAYMFYRYAVNFRHGLGISWNPDAVPTYGTTSLPWIFVVLPFTLLPLTPGHALQLASWIVGTLVLGVLAACVSRYAKSQWLQSPVMAFAAIALPLSVNPVFAFHLTTGMDTVLSLLAHTTLIYAVLGYMERPGRGRALVVGALAFAAILARPDNGVCALGMPFLIWAMAVPGKRRWWDLLGLSALPVVLIGVELLLCTAYFRIPLPLGFYAKSLHSYAGFLNGENAVGYGYIAASCVVPFLGVLAATLKRGQVPMVVAFLLPVGITVAYLLTVRQVMGFGGRYYMPLIPYAIVPALLSVDAALPEGVRPVRLGIALGAAVVLFLALRPVELGLEKRYRAWVMPQPVPVPDLPIAAREPLPYYNWLKQRGISQIIAQLPPGTVIAASEVGYIACISPQVTVIDLVGLNDARIGMHGVSMDELLARAPELIWLPQQHYTGLLATMLEDPRLFERYEVIADVFNFGIAIRRDSALRGEIERGVRSVWPELYPAQKLEDYIVPDSYIPARKGWTAAFLGLSHRHGTLEKTFFDE